MAIGLLSCHSIFSTGHFIALIWNGDPWFAVACSKKDWL